MIFFPFPGNDAAAAADNDEKTFHKKSICQWINPQNCFLTLCIHLFFLHLLAVSMTNKLTRMLKSIVLSLNTVAMGTSPENLKIYRS